MDEKLIKKAQQVYSTICSFIKKKDLKFNYDDEKLCVDGVYTGDDFDMPVYICVDAGGQCVYIKSTLPFKTSEENKVNMALAVCAVNHKLTYGYFDYDYNTGIVLFYLNEVYLDSLISENTLFELLSVSVSTVDDYNDKFLMLNSGIISLDKFIEVINNE